MRVSIFLHKCARARIHLASQGRAECACSCNKRGALSAAPLEAEQQKQAFSGQIWFPARDNSFYLHSAGERGQKIFRWKLFKTPSVMACPLSAWCILCAIYTSDWTNSIVRASYAVVMTKWSLELAKNKTHKVSIAFTTSCRVTTVPDWLSRLNGCRK